MFDKFKKYKTLAAVFVIVAIVILFFSNIRIRSVKKYNADADNIMNQQQSFADNMEQQTTTDDAMSDSFKDSTKQDSESLSEESSGDSKDSQTSEQKDSQNDEQNNKDNEQKNDNNNLKSDSYSSNNESTRDSEKSDEKYDSSKENQNENNSTEVDNKKEIITCTIEIRCDEATKRKDSIENPGLKNIIPDSGCILSTVSYSGESGFSVYDVLSKVANMNGINVDATESIYGVYVRGIAGIYEKMNGENQKIWGGAGWMYKVNGTVPMVAASSYIIKNNDTIVWYYYVS